MSESMGGRISRFLGRLVSGEESGHHESPSPMPRDTADQAARLLRHKSVFGELTPREADLVVSYMWDEPIPAGTAFIKEGDDQDTGFLLLVLKGEATVETLVVSRTDALVMNVSGPGHILGEMGFLDGSPRSATCVASTEMLVGVLTRDALKELLRDHPVVGSKLLMAIATRISTQLRDTGKKLRSYTQLVRAMESDIESLERQLGISNVLHRQQPKA
jgi:CRP-like cAMP-binding protein